MNEIITFKNLVKKHLKSLLFIVFLTLLYSFFQAVPLKILKDLLDETINSVNGGTVQEDLIKLIPVALFYIVAQLLGVFLSSLGRLWTSRAQANIQHQIRLDVYAQLGTLYQNFFDDTSSSDILNKIVQDTDIVVAGFISPITNISASIFSFGFGFYFMWEINPILTLIILPFALVVGALTKLSGGKFRLFSRENRLKNQALWAKYTENIKGMKEIHAQSQDFVQIESIRSFSSDLSKNVIDTAKYHFWIDFLNRAAFILIVGVMLGVGGYFISVDKATPGTVVAIITYNSLLATPIQYLISMFLDIYKFKISSQRLNIIFNNSSDLSYKYSIQSIPETDVAIEINNLNFGYLNHDILFEDLSFSIKPHETTAIVGATGSGKSTILKLIEGLYPLNAGTISVFGKELNYENKLSIRNLISISFQDTFLFNQTLKENIMFGAPKASIDELNKVLRVTLVNEFINKLPDGIDTLVGENGVKLSGGERQRVGLARALIRNPKILLLDEATSSLDNSTEKQIVNNIQNEYKSTTCVIVAHRLNTIEHADKIIVLDHGKIVESGTHQELIQNDLIYKKLYQITKE